MLQHIFLLILSFFGLVQAPAPVSLVAPNAQTSRVAVTENRSALNQAGRSLSAPPQSAPVSNSSASRPKPTMPCLQEKNSTNDYTIAGGNVLYKGMSIPGADATTFQPFGILCQARDSGAIYTPKPQLCETACG